MILNNSSNLTANFNFTLTISNLNMFDWFLIIFALFVFIIGIFGNLLVVIVVLKNSHMKTITNMFIVNLAIGDFFVILIALPPTIVNDVTGIWWFGKPMCKLIPYVQYISVCVSVMTLTAISYERYYAIVYPLKFLATKFRAKVIIIIIWILSILITMPLPIVVTMGVEEGIYCYPDWNELYQNIFDIVILIILYILPMTLIFITYTRVIRVLWKIDNSIAWEDNGTLSNNKTAKTAKKDAISSQTNCTMACGSSKAKTKILHQLSARRKAAKMLIVVAVMFAICYLPINILNFIRHLGTKSTLIDYFLTNFGRVSFQVSHMLVYVNSCINPIIYNLMSDNFRKEFHKIIYCIKKSTSRMNLHLANPDMINPAKSKNFTNTRMTMINTKSIHNDSNHIELLYNDEVHSLKNQDF